MFGDPAILMTRTRHERYSKLFLDCKYISHARLRSEDESFKRSVINFSRSDRRKRSICLPVGPVPNLTAGMRGCLRVACACAQSMETPSHSATSRELSKRSE